MGLPIKNTGMNAKCCSCLHELHGDVYYMEQCGHLFHTSCLLDCWEFGAYGCPCCPGGEVNRFIAEYAEIRREAMRLEELCRKEEDTLCDTLDFDVGLEEFNRKNIDELAKLRSWKYSLAVLKLEIEIYGEIVEFVVSNKHRGGCEDGKCGVCSCKLGGDVHAMKTCSHKYHTRCILARYGKGVGWCQECGKFDNDVPIRQILGTMGERRQEREKLSTFQLRLQDIAIQNYKEGIQEEEFVRDHQCEIAHLRYLQRRVENYEKRIKGTLSKLL